MDPGPALNFSIDTLEVIRYTGTKKRGIKWPS